MKKTFLVEGPRHHLPMINREKDIFQFRAEQREVGGGERREERGESGDCHCYQILVGML